MVIKLQLITGDEADEALVWHDIYAFVKLCETFPKHVLGRPVTIEPQGYFQNDDGNRDHILCNA